MIIIIDKKYILLGYLNIKLGRYKMRLAGKHKRRLFIDKATKWYISINSTIFNDREHRHIVIYAVAEYLANQEGLTLHSKVESNEVL